jgi:hypothetical protein
MGFIVLKPLFEKNFFFGIFGKKRPTCQIPL